MDSVTEHAILKQCRYVCIEGVGMYSIHDSIAAAHGLSSTAQCSKLFSRLKKVYLVEKTPQYHKFPGQGQRETPIAPESDCMDIVRLCLAGSRQPLEKRRGLLQDPDYIPVRTYSEVEIHSCVAKAFSHTRVEIQYVVGPYRVDMYLPDYGIAVECDEDGHSSYDSDKESAREAYVTDALDCTWIRYNPYSDDFDVFNLISVIGERIMAGDALRVEREKTKQAQLQVDMEREKTRQLELQLQLATLAIQSTD